MKLCVGTIHNLPWWRLKNMTEKEIGEFNRGYMVEIEMKQSLESQMIDGVFPTKATDEGVFKMSDEALDKNHDFESKAIVDAWNAAIEAAANRLEEVTIDYECDWSDEIRKLKK